MPIKKLEESLKGSRLNSVVAGSVVEGSIIGIEKGGVLIDLGWRSPGVVPLSDLKIEGLNADKIKKGDKLLVYVSCLENDEGQVELSLKETSAVRKWAKLKQNKKDGKVITVEVVDSNSGGVICEISEGIRGFIPASQLDTSRIYTDGKRLMGRDVSSLVQRKLSALVGEKIEVMIREVDEEKERVILSEKMVLSEHNAKELEAALSKIKEGDVLEGEVTGITPFGVFVNASGIEGLVHLSELSWDKVTDVGSLYAIGDKVKVKVIEIREDGRRVAYSIKRMTKDPWGDAVANLKVGDVVDGVVQKVVRYGAFVRIGKGLNGLVHISEIADGLVRDPADYVQPGDEIQVVVLSISKTDRNLSLSLKRAGGSVSSSVENLEEERYAAGASKLRIPSRS